MDSRGNMKARKRRNAVSVAALAAAFTLAALSAYCEELDFRRPVIVPEPQEMRYENTVPVRIADGMRFVVECPDAGVAKWVAEKARLWWGRDVNVATVATVGLADGALSAVSGSYALRASPEKIEISAPALQGVRYAMYTLRQAAERESAGATVQRYWLPAMTVKDSPALAFRGLHICWFPELSREFIEHQVRLAAYYKFSHVVLEPWGVWQSERFPFLSVPGGQMCVAEARRLSAIADDLGVTLVPGFNVFGHATGLRAASGKHATLDFHPERQTLFEPANGWNWCLSNPETEKAIHGVIAEMHEAYGNPPFFHIGCDEADPPTCARCRAVKPYAKLVERHIASVAGFVRQRGARAMMWHDQLLESGKWKPFYATGDKDLAKMIETLPRDIVVCDWYYGGDQRDKDRRLHYPTLDLFKSKGFDVITCAFDKRAGIVAQGEYANRHGLFGFMETVWHHFKGREFAMMMESSACAAWGHGQTDRGKGVRDRPCVTHWRQIGWDMGIKDYAETGLIRETVTRDILDK